MVAQLLLEAANLMFIGMVAVFAFLLLLVFIVQLISKIMLRYFPQPQLEKALSADNAEHKPSAAVVAAISGAIHQYRKQQ